jgi:fructose PTS system EIIBC or EIIC component
MKIAIITACPSGVANSILAAGLLEKAAKELNWSATVECQSTVMQGYTLSASDIAEADVVIVAANKAIDTSRLVGKKVFQSDISACTKDAVAYLKSAAEQAKELTTQAAATLTPVAKAGKKNRCNYSLSNRCCTHFYGSRSS